MAPEDGKFGGLSRACGTGETYGGGVDEKAPPKARAVMKTPAGIVGCSRAALVSLVL